MQQQPQQHQQGPPPLPHPSQSQPSVHSPYAQPSNSSGPSSQHALPPSSSSSSPPSQPPGGIPSLSSSSSSSSAAASSRPQPNNEQLVALFRERLIASGERARLKALLSSRLAEVQWKAAVVHHCEGVMQKAGVEKATVDMLHQQTIDMARSTVPQHVKQEMLDQIRKSLSKVQREQRR